MSLLFFSIYNKAKFKIKFVLLIIPASQKQHENHIFKAFLLGLIL